MTTSSMNGVQQGPGRSGRHRWKHTPRHLKGVCVTYNKRAQKWVSKYRSNPVEHTDSGFVRYHHVGSFNDKTAALNAAIAAQKQAARKAAVAEVPATRTATEVAFKIASKKAGIETSSDNLSQDIRELTDAVKELTAVIKGL